jgi:hypothetical protein
MQPSGHAQHEADSNVRPSDDLGTKHIDPTCYFALEFHLETLASHVGMSDEQGLAIMNGLSPYQDPLCLNPRIRRRQLS